MTQHAQRRRHNVPIVVVALPFAYREGMDEYNGVMRYLRETRTEWDLRIVRCSFGVGLFRDFPVSEVSGVICGMEFLPGIVSYEPYFPEDVLDLLARHDVPVVCLDVPFPLRGHGRGVRRAYLSVDSEQIGRKAAQVIAKAGEYASYGFVGAFEDRAWSRDRGAFFARELRARGRRNVSIFQGGADSARRDAELVEWLRRLKRPAAVFASNDHCAANVLRLCSGAGLHVPEDFAVLGVDDDPIFCMHTRPTLSSLHPDFEAEGYQAARALAEFLEGRRPPARMVVGGTVTSTERMSTAPSSPAGRLVRRADEIIAERACKKLNAEMLASALGISRRLLDMRYRQINGGSVREAIEEARLARAKELLSGTFLSHAEIARSCGYNSESYLEHVFVRRFGQSMSAFRGSGANGAAEERREGGKTNGRKRS